MDHRTIAEYLHHQMSRKKDDLKYIDKRSRIAKRMKVEIVELKVMVQYLKDNF